MPKNRMDFREAWDLAEEMGMPEGAAAAWAHEMAGLEYGDGFDLLAEEASVGSGNIKPTEERGLPLEPPFTKAKLGDLFFHKARFVKAHEVAIANGCQIVTGSDIYQAAKILGAGVKLVLWSSKGVFSVRDEGSADPAKALAIVNALGFAMKRTSRQNLEQRAKDSTE